ncbi:unnamed protein product [Pelagomonas calceolata]|uniref:GRIP domain-containing protein n=1 Tax=Pelagomonas calceolata TaxID=35677 RepID=A0A7S3ZVF3_9STRA|nr:unnamed protein product [Pelagomonas calceolata]|mmetsp:Transcript_7666/g.22648  ORF Transcript_7666/g.22648 Transcript_7666/m.22648 type:complete len:794 (-) Transcript_7666:20-2401(-)
MSFFQDLKNAAKDLSEHGLNLDNLQEEVGCEKREPLPALPPTRSETQTVTPAAVDDTPEPVEDEGPGLIENVAALGESVGEKTELMRQKSEALLSSSRDFFVAAGERIKKDAQTVGGSLGLAPAEEEANEALAEAATPAEAPAAAPEAPKEAPAPPPPPASSPRTLATGDRARFRLPDKSVHRGIVTSVNGDGTYSVTEDGTGAVHRLPDNKVKKDDGTPPAPKPKAKPKPAPSLKAPPPTPPKPKPKPKAPKPPPSPPRSSLTAMLRGTTVTRGTQQQERAWEGEAAARAADAARLEAEVLTLRRDKARSDAELERHRVARADAQQAARAAQNERDACAAELEAVALREVDSLQAEVASLRREKRRAEQLRSELEAARNEIETLKASSSNNTRATEELRAAKLSLDAARRAAAASARAQRARVDARERQHRDDQRECSELRERVAASERRAAQAERMARTNADEAQDRLRIARDLDAKDRDAAELRGLLRSAVRDKKLLEARVAELRSSAGRLEKQVGDRDGELLAARRATREAREAFVETNGRNGKEKGAVEYLKSVVRTALPPRGGAPDAATVRRLLPVLRSLLHLPHEQVESNIEALGSTGSGGEFAAALLEAAAENAGGVVSPATAAELQRRADELAAARQLVKALEDDAEELRDELRRCNDESSARAQRDREALTSVEARLQALVEAVRRRSEGLGLLRAVASEAHKLATDAAAQQDELRRDAVLRQAAVDAGLDGEQLEYLRTTIVCFLSTPNAQLKRQLLPVLQQVLKLPPGDERAATLAALDLS